MLLSFSAFAIEKTDYGYYDCNEDGKIGLADAISALDSLINTENADFTLVRILHICKAISATEPLAVTVTAIDENAVTFSSLYSDNISLPRTALDPEADISDLVGQDATLLVHTPASTVFEGYNGDGRGIYAVLLGQTTEEAPVADLLSIRDLNKNSENGSHAEDDYLSASLEINYRENVVLSSAKTTYTRYDMAYYPRVKKVSDDLYVMFWMYSSLGQHLYYATSVDGQTWNEPKVLWNSANHKFTYESGSLAGTEDRYYAVNADACVLDNGDILCVYAVRPNKGYGSDEYIDMNGLWMMRGTVDANNNITWSKEQKIYTGHLWEPFIHQRTDGQIEIYWSSIVAYVDIYGFDSDKRSTCTTMIVSNDNGYTWTPNIQPGDTNHYVATRVFQQAIGNKVPYGDYTEAVPYFGGQMPSAVQLYNGKTILAVEVQQLDKSFDISIATSKDGGKWDALGLTETGPSTKMENLFDGAAPYLARFPSGEVFLTYNNGSTHYGRMVRPDGLAVASTAMQTAPGVSGYWGATEVIDSHAMITSVLNEVTVSGSKKNELRLYYSYLNHRVNAKNISANVDGYINDWVNNTDALFVGSESQAQITLQTAHDAENIYFLVCRPDNDLQSGDTALLHIAAGDTGYYTVTLDLDGNYSVTKNGSSTVLASGKTVVKTFTAPESGAVIECAVPKSALGLVGAASFKVAPTLVNKDGTAAVISDTLTGISLTSTANWPTVVLN